MKAYVVKHDGKTIPSDRPGAMAGEVPKYWTKSPGITLFIFESDGITDLPFEEAMPGMVGIDYTGQRLYNVLENGDAKLIGTILIRPAIEIEHVTPEEER